MDAHLIYETLTRRGFSLELEGDRLAVSPAAALSDVDRSTIRENKTAIIEYLKSMNGSGNGHRQARKARNVSRASSEVSAVQTPANHDGDNGSSSSAQPPAPDNSDGIPCRRCHGTGQEPDVPSVAEVIAATVKAAAWSDWPPEVVRTKLEAALALGDKVVAINWYQLLVERPSGEIIIVARHDA